MKKINFILITVATALITNSAMAEKDDFSYAIPLGEKIVENSTRYRASDANRTCRSLVSTAFQQFKIDITSQQVAGLEGDLQYSCSKVLVSVITKSNREGNMLSMDRGWLDADHYRTTTITAKCIPRKLSEKQIYSFSKKCEVEPQPACFEDVYLKRLDELQPTQWIENTKNSCL